jgi:UPF0271 protein
MKTIDLNSDLGESFGPWNMGDDAAMLGIVSSANVACGGHAGDSATMFDTLTVAAQNGVCVGAHPGFEDRQGFGRRRLPLTMTEIEQLIAAQVGTLKGVAGLAGTTVRYVKPHGALGNWAAESEDVASAIARAIKRAHSDCAVLAISGTALETVALKSGLETYSEIFADRGYGDDGNLVPRSKPGAMIEDADTACQRLIEFFDNGRMPTVSGGYVSLKAHSICIHGDNPHAVDMGRTIKAQLIDAGFDVQPFITD